MVLHRPPGTSRVEYAYRRILAVIEDPPLIALFASPHRLQLFDTEGRKRGQAPDITGVGRMLRTAPGWLAAFAFLGVAVGPASVWGDDAVSFDRVSTTPPRRGRFSKTMVSTPALARS